jgi:hypothetical protein
MSFECKDEFSYLGDMIGDEGGTEDASRTRVRCLWIKFRELATVLTSRGASLWLKGKIYSAYVCSVMLYGRMPWPVKIQDKQRL